MIYFRAYQCFNRKVIEQSVRNGISIDILQGSVNFPFIVHVILVGTVFIMECVPFGTCLCNNSYFSYEKIGIII